MRRSDPCHIIHMTCICPAEASWGSMISCVDFQACTFDDTGDANILTINIPKKYPDEIPTKSLSIIYWPWDSNILINISHYLTGKSPRNHHCCWWNPINYHYHWIPSTIEFEAFSHIPILFQIVPMKTFPWYSHDLPMKISPKNFPWKPSHNIPVIFPWSSHENLQIFPSSNLFPGATDLPGPLGWAGGDLDEQRLQAVPKSCGF